MTEGDLNQFAIELRARGRSAEVSTEEGRQGHIGGLRVDGVFFPQWELELVENQQDLFDLHFAAIQSRRPPNFEYAEPWYWPNPARLDAKPE